MGWNCLPVNLSIILTGREETVLFWLHIGHSYMTQCFMLKGEEPPFCILHYKLISLDHILLHCSDFIEIRVSYFGVSSFEVAAQRIPLDSILNFLKEINVFLNKLQLIKF